MDHQRFEVSREQCWLNDRQTEQSGNNKTVPPSGDQSITPCTIHVLFHQCIRYLSLFLSLFSTLLLHIIEY